MKSVTSTFYQRAAWIKCKNSYLKSVNGLCERCAKKGDFKPADIVHHKIHLSDKTVNEPSIAYCFDNLEALCQDCHNKEHFGSKEEPRYLFVDGKLVIKDDSN